MQYECHLTHQCISVQLCSHCALMDVQPWYSSVVSCVHCSARAQACNAAGTHVSMSADDPTHCGELSRHDLGMTTHLPALQVIGRVSGLTLLNGSDVKARERHDAELRYLQNVMSQLEQLGGTEERAAAQLQHPRLKPLLAHYGAVRWGQHCCLWLLCVLARWLHAGRLCLCQLQDELPQLAMHVL